MSGNSSTTVAASSSETPAAMGSASDSRPPRNRRRGHRSARQGNDRATAPTTLQSRTVAGGRQFGGQLTILDADAPPFVPASVHPTHPGHRPPRARSNQQSQPPKSTRDQGRVPLPATGSQRVQPQGKRRGSFLRSTAPDLTTRVHEDITKGVYECAICTNEVSRSSKIWSCRTCWTVFHIGCIKKWSKNEGSAAPQQAGEQVSQSVKHWRCPGCNLPKEVLPTTYNCWCEKEIDPKAIGGLPPHSCGQTCGRERTFPKACPHPCDMICHAGPCPPCSHVGPIQSCFCGKNSTSRKCLETDYEFGWSCDEPCGDLMPCGDHICPRNCHEGLCGACETEVETRCYCGKVEKKMKCCEKEEEKPSYDWTGSFDCRQVCENSMDCGEHRCEKTCHPQEAETPHCPLSTDRITFCPCGKTSLSSLSSQPRKSCMDPIPNCKEVCGKTLACGHTCDQVCHSGDCLPCLRTVSISCGCGRNNFTTICHQGTEEPPQCLRICKATLNCGRHECGQRCCTGERKAIERQATKRKLKPLGLNPQALENSFEDEHICTKICGRLLKCGNHYCAELCHKGPCSTCKEAIFDDISCNCGQTVFRAPLPCGTQPPPCNFSCNRPKSCGHPQVGHSCHTEDEACPNCPFLTEKACMCGKKVLKNQPCWRSDVLCGLICGKKLKCGSHFCQKPCHRPGECEDATTPCRQVCAKPKKSCGHPCEKACHAPSACKEDNSCPFKIMITCDCQRKKEEVRCNARASAPNPPGRQNSLKCDDECARLQRNRNLALALNVTDSHTDDHVPYSTATLNMYLEDVNWAHTQEEALRLFAADLNEKRLRLKPMKRRQRGFIHSIAEDFGFDAESLDPEPNRHVLLFKTPKFVAAPMKTLAQAARIKRAALAIAAPVNSVPERRADEAKHDYNGLLLTKPKFALTEEELWPHLKKAASTTDFDIVFLSAEDQVALLPSRSWETPDQLTILLSSLLPMVAAEVTKHNLGASVSLCLFDTTNTMPVVMHQQGGNGSASTSGWSQVAAKRAGTARAPQVQAAGQRPMYTVLGSKLAEAKRKKAENEELERQKRETQQDPVVDDWEEEVEKEDDGILGQALTE